MSNKRAVILAGGLGKRLRPYTAVFPKPLMPIGDYPILEVVIMQLANHGFNHITLAVNHQAQMFKTFFSDGSKWNVKIDYSMEDKPLSTMGPLQLIRDLPETFLVMNGDILTDLDFSSFYRDHVSDGSLFSISSFIRKHEIDYGVLDVDERRRLRGFTEKPVRRFEVSMGIYMVSKETLSFIPKDTFYGFDNLMGDLLKAEKQVRVRVHEGVWLDIGRPDDYIEAIDRFEGLKAKLLNG